MTTLNQPLGHNAPDALVGENAAYAQQYDEHESPTNVGSTDRTVSTAAGAVLAAAGLARRGWPGLVMAAVGGSLIYRGVTGWCHCYQALGIDTANGESPAAAPEDYYARGIHVEQAFTVNKTPWELYQYWRNFENLPRIMSHLESV